MTVPRGSAARTRRSEGRASSRSVQPGVSKARPQATKGKPAEAPEPAAEPVAELQNTSACDCGHPIADHLGADGPCTFEDGRGVCSCGGFTETAAETVTGFSPDDARIEAAVAALTDGVPGAAEIVRLRLTELRVAAFADGAVALPAELLPRDDAPERTDSPPVVTPSPAPLGAKRWTAVLLPEGRLTDDGRAFAPGSVTWRELPLTLMGMTVTQEGHDGAQVAGRIDRIWRDEAAGLIRAEGVFDEGEYGQEIARMVADGVLTGNSVDVAILESEVGPASDWFDGDGNWAPAEFEDTEAEPADAPSLIDILFGDSGDMVRVATKAVIGMSTVCPFPAFADAGISMAASLVASPTDGVWTVTQNGGYIVTNKPAKPDAVVEAALVAAADLAPAKPPAAWFRNPELAELTPLTIDDDGRVFGHAAEWGTCHIAFPDACVTPPYSHTEYAYFHLGEVECDDGSRVSVGKITIDAGHAGSHLSRVDATAHYDHTGTVAAYVVCGEDEFGPWFSGTVSPDITDEKLRLLRGSVLSGDWRGVNGNLELVALLAVNVPGFPVPRPRALVASGADGQEVIALLAAGIVVAGDHVAEAKAQRLEEFAALKAKASGVFDELAAQARVG